MTSHALKFLVVVVKIVPSVARSRESVKKLAEAPCRPRQATRCFTKLCARLQYKFKEIQSGVFYGFFFDKRGIAKSVVNEHFNGKLLFPNSDYRTMCLNNVPR